MILKLIMRTWGINDISEEVRAQCPYVDFNAHFCSPNLSICSQQVWEMDLNFVQVADRTGLYQLWFPLLP